MTNTDIGPGTPHLLVRVRDGTGLVGTTLE